MEKDFYCSGCGSTVAPKQKLALQKWLCEKCFTKAQTEKFNAQCPSLFHHTDANRLPAAQLKQVLTWQYGPKGLLLAGETGRCKTRCAWLLIKRLIVEDGLSVVTFDSVGFGRELERRYREEDDVTGWLDRLGTGVEVVFFDDLGKLKITERVETELFGVIDQRSSHELPIIATTNDHGDTLSARMSDNRGAPLIRRLREFCTAIPF